MTLERIAKDTGVRLRELTVIENDDGIRPAGKPDRCFYCDQQIGQQHLFDCAVVVKEVELIATFKTTKGEELDESLHFRVTVPHFWNEGDIAFHFNESTWCKDNISGYVVEDDEERAKMIWKRLGLKKDQCVCRCAAIHFGKVIDEGPYIEQKTYVEEEVDP